MELDWTTVIFELANFGVLLLLLTRFLFRPVRNILRERKSEIESIREEAESARTSAETAKTEYARLARELEADVDDRRRRAVTEGEAAATRLVEDAREGMRRAHESVAKEVEQSREEALASLRGELVQLAIGAGRRILEEMGAPDVAVAFARRGARRLREEAQTNGKLRVKALVSRDADLYAVSLVLKEALGDAEVEVLVDDALVGGVKLLADGLEVEASAGAALEQWFLDRAQEGLAEGEGTTPSQLGMVS